MIQVTAASHRHEDNSELGLLEQRPWGSLAPQPLPTPPEPLNGLIHPPHLSRLLLWSSAHL